MGDAFYTEQGQIKNVDQAHEVANLVVDKGTRAAEAREVELKRQTETGLTDAERNNLAIMAGVQEKYPDAFVVVTDPKGREFLKLKTSNVNNSIYFTQFGVMFRSEPMYDRRLEDYMVVDTAESASKTKGTRLMMDLGDNVQAQSLKTYLLEGQARGVSEKEANATRARSASVQGVLARL